MKKKMFLITKDYPFGNSETSFIDNEYKMLSDVYDIYTVATECKENISLSEGRNSCTIHLQVTFLKKILFLLRFLLEKDAWLEVRAIFSEKKNILKNLMRAMMYGTYAEIFFYKIRRKTGLSKDTKALFYFYWWDYKCLGLTMHKRQYPGIKIITRTHGYDLYSEREQYGRQYFKPQMDRELERIIFVAYYGKEYYLEKYRISDSKKYAVHYMGVNDPKADIEKERSESFMLVSCSNAIPLKRINLIIDGLSRIKEIDIKWVHIGDGSELENLKAMAKEKLGGNIKYTFYGRMLNKDVINFYAENNVSCFITTTSTEGNPVSIQEALSFGIPVIATSVSDIPRMIDNNGVLLPKDPTGGEVADAIRTVAMMDSCDYLELKKNSYRIFRRDYNAERNYQELIGDLIQIEL